MSPWRTYRIVPQENITYTMALPVKNGGSVAVIGAGVTGLTYAYFLNRFRPDLAITVYDKSRRPGGWIDTLNVHLEQPKIEEIDAKDAKEHTHDTTRAKASPQSIKLEKGPRTLRGVSPGTVLIVDTLKQLGHGDEVLVLNRKSVANRKWIWSGPNQRLVAVPSSPLQIKSFLTNVGLAKWGFFGGLMKEGFVDKGPPDESVQSFFARRFGNTLLVDNVLSAVLHGIYAGDTKQLSVTAILPKLKLMEQEYGSITKRVVSLLNPWSKKLPKQLLFPAVVSSTYDKINPEANLAALAQKLKHFPMIALKLGLEAFPRALYGVLQQTKGVDFVFESKIDSVSLKGEVTNAGQSPKQFDHVRFTGNALDFGIMLNNGPIREQVEKLKYVDIMLVNIFCREPRLIPNGRHGFGFLIPRLSEPNNEGLLGVIFDLDVEQNIGPMESKAKPKANSYNKITLMMGGHYFNSLTGSLSERYVRELVNSILTRYLDVDTGAQKIIYRNEAEHPDKEVTLAPTDFLVSYNFHRQCIPQYHIGYVEDKAAVHKELDNTNVSVGGMAYGNGIGVPDCVMNSYEAAVAASFNPDE